ncbi:MAG: SnoaL-like domain-containing protein [Acidobacteria bacterium]|nr:SnoaL-like domain-containing protein [Acidobacteriota bacterium]
MAEPNNVAIAQKAYRLFNEGNIAELMTHVDNNVEYHYHAPQALVPYGDGINGHAALLQFFGQLDELYEFEQFEPREFVGHGDKVFITGVFRAKVKATGEVIGSDWVHINRYQHGKLVRNDLFENSAQTAHALAGRNIAIARRVIEEGWNQNKFDVIDECYSPDAVLNDPNAAPEERQGIAGRKSALRRYKTAFPDLHFTISDITASGEMVYYHWTATGTHQGELNGIPPTGKNITVTGTSSDRIVNGKIVEDWAAWDTLGMLQQLGVIPVA